MECEFLTGQLRAAEERLAPLSNRATTGVEKAIVACLQMDVFTTSAHVLDDGVIDPRDTRTVLSFVLNTCEEAARRVPHPMAFSVSRP